MICPMRSITTPPNAPQLPAGSPFARVSLVGPNAEHRAEVEAFIADVYRDAFGASVDTFLPALIAFHAPAGSLSAVVGLRAHRPGVRSGKRWAGGVDPGGLGCIKKN